MCGAASRACSTALNVAIFLSHTWYSRYWEYQQVGFFVVKFIVVVVKILTARDLYVPRTIPYKKNPRSGAYVVGTSQAPRWLGFGRYLETRPPSGKESVPGLLPKTKIVHHTMCNKPPGECLFFCGLEADALAPYCRRKFQVDMSD